MGRHFFNEAGPQRLELDDGKTVERAAEIDLEDLHCAGAQRCVLRWRPPGFSNLRTVPCTLMQTGNQHRQIGGKIRNSSVVGWIWRSQSRLRLLAFSNVLARSAGGRSPLIRSGPTVAR